jgi:hypothetical protein
VLLLQVINSRHCRRAACNAAQEGENLGLAEGCATMPLTVTYRVQGARPVLLPEAQPRTPGHITDAIELASVLRPLHA